ncbi:hypothetical protein P171DRAFT_444231 [Karstenula rhodostoma CBS 690.94]|uniref:CRAL-TRIO domain-containing protein n=1 Tax=Karstenula rhodostoma CBS 690.94 TaxID=1392251 RepID=A0A9P4PHA6_9PLEO|nr:hypothetical protein P171DRAFT_444231 [Karstenula rhodostoma CBS 690.94]
MASGARPREREERKEEREEGRRGVVGRERREPGDLERVRGVREVGGWARGVVEAIGVDGGSGGVVFVVVKWSCGFGDALSGGGTLQVRPDNYYVASVAPRRHPSATPFSLSDQARASPCTHPPAAGFPANRACHHWRRVSATICVFGAFSRVRLTFPPMSCRVRAVARAAFKSTSPPGRLLPKRQSWIRDSPYTYYPPAEPRAYHYKAYRAPPVPNQSGSTAFTALVVLGIAVSGALLYPLVSSQSAEDIAEYRPAQTFEYTDRPDSYLVMVPNMPAGRPGTLTPEQEGKLREFWAATLKVFGTRDEEANGVEPAPAAVNDATEKDGKKDKKKSRLHVFRRNKGDKADSDTASVASTPSTSTPDISRISLEDDKHGQNKDFRDAIANTAPEDLRRAFWSMLKMDHPDALLLRFLRARKWDVDKALIMMISTMHWRLEQMHVDDDIMKKGEEAALKESKSDDPKVKKDAEGFLAQLRMGKSYLHGMDAENRPLCIVRARLHRAGEQSEASLERYTVYTIETARLLLRAPIDTATVVFDMTDFSMANMDYAPVKFMIKCFEANYPESLGTVLVYKAPWVFNAIWSVIKGWLDPVVAGKVHFAKNVNELEKFVPRTQIPKELDGEDPYAYTYPEPVEGENARDEAPKAALESERHDLVAKYERTILEWVAEGDAGKSLDDRRRERDAIAENLRDNYWKLDPFVRARSLYDRIGLVGEAGKLSFYPQRETESARPPVDTSADDLD